jgi:hypothetical protein
MICQACGVEAPTKYVAFYQNIGALVIRFSQSVEGDLCKSCIHRYFWKYTAVNMGLGWWGMISLVLTPFFLLNNTARYVMCLGMDPVPPRAMPPRLSQEDFDRIMPYGEQIFDRLGRKEPLDEVARSVAMISGVTPGQVVLFIRAAVQAMSEQR